MKEHVHLNLCSGGLDSFLAWWLMVPTARNVYVRIGHPYEGREMVALERLHHVDSRFTAEVLQGPYLGHLETTSGIIPCRNALLALTAAAQLAHERNVSRVTICLGILAGEINSDKSVEFCQTLGEVLSISWRPQYWTDGILFDVVSPVRAYTKTQLIQSYLLRGGDLGVLGHTSSCYHERLDKETGPHCGTCTACLKRWIGFRAAGVDDPTRYVVDPRDGPLVPSVREKALDGTYDPIRSRETLRALEDA